MSENRAKVIASCLAAHSALEALLLELSQDEQGTPAPQSSALHSAEPASPCSHEKKRHLRTFGVAEHWECEDCGFEYRR